MNKQKLVAPILLVTTILSCLYAESFKPGEELLNPHINTSFKVYAQETSGMIAGQASSPELMTEEEQIKAYIDQVFGEHAEEAKTIALCESKFREKVIGDTNIMNYDQKHGEMVGDSIGVFQIRTGGKDFNRARANKMTADEFRAYLKDYRNNVDYAKTIFNRQGWQPWSCKKDLK